MVYHWAQAHCRLKTMEAEMSTEPWRRIVCVCNYADQWALYLLYRNAAIGASGHGHWQHTRHRKFGEVRTVVVVREQTDRQTFSTILAAPLPGET